MRVAKTVTTRYTVDFINKKFNPHNIAQAILDLEKAGVNIVEAEVDTIGEAPYKKLVLTVVKNTHYDDSTLARMENGAI